MPTVTHIIDQNLPVYATGDQTISGIKTFEGLVGFYKNGSLSFAGYGDYATQVNGNLSGIILTTFQSPTDITIRSDFIGGNSDAVISVRNYSLISEFFGNSINNEDGESGDQIIIYSTGSTYSIPNSKGPYLRLGKHNIISEKSGSKLGIGTLFPQEKVHVSGGNLRVDGGASFSNRPTVNGTGVLLSGEAAQVDLSSTVRTTGNQTISGTKTFVVNTLLYSGVNVNFNSNTNVKFSGNTDFAKLPTVNDTGILLVGQNSVIFNCSTSFIAYSANTTGYFSNFNAGSTNGVSASERQMPILDNFIAKKYVYSIQPESVGTPWSDIKCTGYFINTTQQKTGVILTGIPALGTVTANKVYNYTGTLNIPINAGDNVVCALNSVDAIQSIRSIVQIYLYN